MIAVITVSVGPQHVKRGVRRDWDACMTALAINEHLRDGYHARVDGQGVEILRGRALVLWTLLPDWARRRSEDFDAGLPVAPFSFPLRLPAEALRQPPSTEYGDALLNYGAALARTMTAERLGPIPAAQGDDVDTVSMCMNCGERDPAAGHPCNTATAGWRLSRLRDRVYTALANLRESVATEGRAK